MASERIQRRIGILLDEADGAIAHSDWVVVLDRAQNVLRLDPDIVDALSYLAAAERDIKIRSSPTSTSQNLLAVSEDVPTEVPTAAVTSAAAECRRIFEPMELSMVI